MARKIIHLDLDAFFCSVEELHNEQLRGKAFAVGGRPHERGVVSSCSYPARKLGVRSAMPTGRALRLCPDLLIIPPHYSSYEAMSQQVMDCLHSLSPLVEHISIDEAFIDVSDLPEPLEAIAQRLQTDINQNIKLPCSLGLATNKLVAKIATDVGKASAPRSGPPNTITRVPDGEEAVFLAPLPVESLWGVGPKTAARLAEMGVRTIGELARRSINELSPLFGTTASQVHAHALGNDERPVITSHHIKSISQEVTFSRDVHDEQVLLHTLFELSEKVGKRLREAHLLGATIRLKIRWPDFTTLTRQVSLKQATDQDQVIYSNGVVLFKRVYHAGQSVRLIGLGVSGIGPVIRQLNLWDQLPDLDASVPTERGIRLQTALDHIRERYGHNSVQRGIAHSTKETENCPVIINPEKPQPTWSIFEIITIFVAIGSLVILGTLGIALLTRLQPDHFPGIKHTTLLQTILLTTVEIVSFTGCIYLLALRRRKLGWQAVGLRITSKVWALIAVLLSILLIPLSGLIAVIIQYLSGSPARNPQLAFLAPEGFSWTALISLLILVGILGPIAEELLFRGIFYQSLRQRWGVWLAAVVSALLFAVMHGDWVVGAVAFVLGLVLAWIFEVSGSLWPAIIIHILNNSIRIIAVYLLLGLGIEIENYITALPILLNGLCSVK